MSLYEQALIASIMFCLVATALLASQLLSENAEIKRLEKINNDLCKLIIKLKKGKK